MDKQMQQAKETHVHEFLTSVVEKAIKMTEDDFEIMMSHTKSVLSIFRKKPNVKEFISSPQGATTVNMNIQILLDAVKNTEIMVEAVPNK